MKNILNVKPSKDLTGRLKFSTEFVDFTDIENKKILNIGCGFGWFEIFALKNQVQSISGIEISENDLRTAKESVVDKKAEFKVGSAIAIPYRNNTFDTVVSWEVIEHIPRKTEEKMFHEVSRVLKPNGVFYLSTPFKHFISNALDPAWWLIGHRHYSKKQLKQFGAENNLNLVKLEIKGKHWALLALLNMYISKWIFRRSPFLENYFNMKNDKEYFNNKEGYFNIFVKYVKNN